MSIFLKYDGIDGAAPAGGKHAGGMLVGMGDGSVRFLKNSVNPAASGFQPYGMGFRGGVSVATASMNTYGGLTTVNAGLIHVSRISLPDSPFGTAAGIDSFDANASGKVRTLFDTQRSMVTSLTVTFSVPRNNTPQFQRLQSTLRQMALSGRRIPAMQLFVSDAGNPKGVRYRFENVRVVSVSSSASGSVPTDQVTMNFAKIDFDYGRSAK